MGDSDSLDSDEGIRYKTENVRNEQENSSLIDSGNKNRINRRSSNDNNKGRGDEGIIGPVLPLNFLSKTDYTTEYSLTGPALPLSLTKSDSKSLSVVEPVLPPHTQKQENICTLAKSNSELSIGPQLPPHMMEKGNVPSSLNSEQENEHISTSRLEACYAPQLPPHLLNKLKPSNTSAATNINQDSESIETSDEKTFGPVLPPQLRDQLQLQAERQSQDETNDSDDEPEVFGPLPAGTSKYTASQVALEERALQLQINKLGPQDNTAPVRESWMIDLPEAKAAAQFGLGPRQFRNRAGPDMSDRSSWTDIAGEKNKRANKAKKVDIKAEAEARELQKRDKEQELLTKKHKRKSKSLVDIHQDKLRKKDEGVITTERKPFNRETDLQVNKFDEAQRKAVLKKAQLLDDRFSSGKSKFL